MTRLRLVRLLTLARRRGDLLAVAVLETRLLSTSSGAHV